MFHLARMNFPEVDQVSRRGRALAIIPVGSVEEHGPHLPLGLDTFAAETYAGEIASHLEARGFEVVLAPPVYYGVARRALGFPGTLTVRPETLTALLSDVGAALFKHGFARQVMLNGHRDLEHMAAIGRAARSLTDSGVKVVTIGFVSDPKMTAACYREGMEGLSRSTRPEREGHAGEWETSLALHSFPQWVDRETAATLAPNLTYDVEAFRAETTDYEILSNGTGYFGSPAVANSETGEKLLAIRARNMARIILEAFEPASARAT